MNETCVWIFRCVQREYMFLIIVSAWLIEYNMVGTNVDYKQNNHR